MGVGRSGQAGLGNLVERSAMHIISSKACLVAAVVTVLTSGSVHADNEDVIAECARISSTGDRILCLENALRGLSGESEAVTPAYSTDIIEQESQPVEIASEAVPATEEELAETHESATVSASVNERPDSSAADTPTIAPAAEAIPDRTVRTADAEPGGHDTTIDQFGAIEEKTVDEEPAAIDVRVIEVSDDPYGKLIFTTESGQVWYQTDKRSARFRDVPFDANIRKAAAGSFMLRKQSGGVSVRVKRRN